MSRVFISCTSDFGFSSTRLVHFDRSDPECTRDDLMDFLCAACDDISMSAIIQRDDDDENKTPRGSYRAWLALSWTVPDCNSQWVEACVRRAMLLEDYEWEQIDVRSVGRHRSKFEITMHCINTAERRYLHINNPEARQQFID